MKLTCKACGAKFTDEAPKASHSSQTAEDFFFSHVFSRIYGGDLSHIFAYPEYSAIGSQKPSEGRVVAVDEDLENDEYFYEARVSGDKRLILVYSDGKSYYTKEYRIHLSTKNKDIEKLEKIAKNARAQFFRASSGFRVVKIDDRYAIISGNGGSYIDNFCQSLMKEFYNEEV